MQKGFIAISSVIIVAAVVLAISLSAAMLAINEGQSALSLSRGESSLNFVEGCAEDALLKLNLNGSYSGGTITRPEGTCSIAVTNVAGIYTITATTTSTKYVRTVEVKATRSTSLTITSWKEI